MKKLNNVHVNNTLFLSCVDTCEIRILYSVDTGYSQSMKTNKVIDSKIYC